ncbi:hypothetical protein ATE80_12915 [Streptomyces kanasensis]|uniref:Uncharacterized protein n=1 Tax=Streptomyces kanasensis TaxID=936756 RepID=A0A100Y622_9ACTN|nr:hypothetical protein ATE80_12915 [Streptomyces kanasensis]
MLGGCGCGYAHETALVPLNHGPPLAPEYRRATSAGPSHHPGGPVAPPGPGRRTTPGRTPNHPPAGGRATHR